jgi:Fe-S-cluster containining protein
MYRDLDRGDGTCRHYDDATHLCRIYAHRPLRCNVDAFYETYLKDQMTYEMYVAQNRAACAQLRAALQQRQMEKA